MTTKSAVVRCVTLLCLAGMAASLRSDVNTESENTLAGLEGVFVIAIGSDKPQVTDSGVTSEWIRQTAELRLRRNGVRVLTVDEFRKARGPVSLAVAVDVQPPDAGRRLPGIYVESTRTSLVQRVLLERDPTIKVTANTWEKSSLGTVGADKFKSGTQQEIEDQVDAFSNAFLAQNPKK